MTPLLILSSLAVAILTYFLYRSKPVRFLLRIFPALLILLLIVNFTVGIKLTRKTNPPVVLIDLSPSMARYIADLIGYAGNPMFERTQFFFSDSVFTTLPDSTKPLGRFTNITGALLKASEMEPSSIILVSDGNHNYGEVPSAQFGTIQAPVFCFGVGSDTIEDISIADVHCPEYLYQGDSAAIEVIVESKGFRSGRGEIVLRSSDRRIEQKKSFPLSETSARQSIIFKIVVPDFGEKEFSVNILPHPGEIDYENNQTSLAVNVLQQKIGALYYTDHVSFNTRFILNSLRQNPHVGVTALARLAGDEYWDLKENRLAQNLPQLDNYDIVILDNIRSAKIPWQDLEPVVKRGKGLLFTGSVESMREDIKQLLPIDMVGNQVHGEFKVKVTRPFSILSPLQSYPPFHSMNRAVTAKPKSIVIATAADLPAIAYLSCGKGITFQINCVNLGNWEFIHVGSKNDGLLPRLLNDIIRLLSPQGREHRLVLKTRNAAYVQGEIVNLRLESYDHDFMLRSGGDFYVQYHTRKIPFFETKPGIYDANFNADSSGIFEIKAVGSLDAEDMTSNTVKINIAGLLTESETTINKALLVEISEKTGGEYHPFDKIADFEPPAATQLRVTRKLAIDTPVVYLAVFLLLAFDWFLRKKHGMI